MHAVSTSESLWRSGILTINVFQHSWALLLKFDRAWRTHLPIKPLRPRCSQNSQVFKSLQIIDQLNLQIQKGVYSPIFQRSPIVDYRSRLNLFTCPFSSFIHTPSAISLLFYRDKDLARLEYIVCNLFTGSCSIRQVAWSINFPRKGRKCPNAIVFSCQPSTKSRNRWTSLPFKTTYHLYKNLPSVRFLLHSFQLQWNRRCPLEE